MTLRVGGAGLLIGALLQLGGAVPVALPGTFGGSAPILEILAWGLGGLVLLAAAIPLAQVRAGHPGVTGGSRPGRAATLVLGGSGLLLLAWILSALSTSDRPATLAVLTIEQAVVFVASAATALTAVRTRVLAGGARWSFVPLAALDATTLLLSCVHQLGLPFLAGVFVLRPVLLIAIGGTFLLRAHSLNTPTKRRMRRT